MTTTVAALFVDLKGTYRDLPVDLWDEARDARNYPGPHPVVAHPPCQRWGSLAKACFGRYPQDEFRVGNDGGCFASALASVRRWGGVLEHPAKTMAWAAFSLTRPQAPGWTPSPQRPNEWTCEVWQSAYGHLARKATWLLYVGDNPPPPMNWARIPGTHQIGFQDQRGKAANKPTLSGRKASATPPAFAEALLNLARNAR